MSVASDLTLLGWRTDGGRLNQAIRDFQAAWNLGPALTVDGNAGSKTLAALKVSVDRHRAGKPDISANFNAAEFACKCDKHGGPWPDCRRIWAPRSTIQMAEKWRKVAGTPGFTPERACRCAEENRRVGGAPKSQHLSGRGLDVPITTLTVSQARAALGTVGIGTYTGNGRLYVRHVDNRGSWAQWDYGDLGDRVPLKPRPDLATTTKPSTAAPSAKPQTTTPTVQEDDMPLTDADVAKITKAVWSHQLAKPGNTNTESAGGQLGKAHIFAYRGNGAAVALQAKVEALNATVGVLASAQGLDPALVQKTIEDSVAKALGRLKITTDEQEAGA